MEAIMTRKPVVLCPIDFSEASRGALRYAAAIAEHFESEVTIVTINDPLLSDADTLTAGEGHMAEETAREMERFFRETFANRPMGIARARFESVTGTPAAEILGLAARSHADVIVMSSHGATGVRKLFFGSTAERVLRETSVPILVTPAGDAGPALLSDVRKTVRRVVAPVDLSDASGRQVRLASGLAQALDVSLLLVHIVEPVRSARPGWRPRLNVDSERRDRAERQLESMIGTLPGRAKAEALVVFGEPSEEIAKVAHDRDAGLIVMGLHASPLLGPRMGSVTYRVLCLAHVLVLALPPVPVGTGTAGVRADRRDAGGIAGGAVA
jgi:nucleotide-binding universal stress UspA family protein